MRALLLGFAVTTSLFAACGGPKSEPAAPAAPSSATPAGATGDTAPGGVPGTPDQCCCELPDSRGMQLQSNAECAGQAGTCKPETECTAAEGPK